MSIAYEYNNVFEREKTKDVYTIVHGQMMHLFICKSRPSTESTNIQGIKWNLFIVFVIWGMSRISGLRNDMNKRTFYKERRINKRCIHFLRKQNIKPPLILDMYVLYMLAWWYTCNFFHYVMFLIVLFHYVMFLLKLKLFCHNAHLYR